MTRFVKLGIHWSMVACEIRCLVLQWCSRRPALPFPLVLPPVRWYYLLPRSMCSSCPSLKGNSTLCTVYTFDTLREPSKGKVVPARVATTTTATAATRMLSKVLVSLPICSVYIVQCILFSICSTMHSVQYIQYNAFRSKPIQQHTYSVCLHRTILFIYTFFLRMDMARAVSRSNEECFRDRRGREWLLVGIGVGLGVGLGLGSTTFWRHRNSKSFPCRCTLYISPPLKGNWQEQPFPLAPPT